MSKLRIKQGVRIRDVAAAAGVSKTTVSLIVNGRADQEGISLATRQPEPTTVPDPIPLPEPTLIIVPELVAVAVAEPVAEEPLPPQTPTDPNAIPVTVEAESGAAEEVISADSTNAISANA